VKNTHSHHIIPKHAGGPNEPLNLKELSIFEHAEAHRILYEEYGRAADRMAWRMLSGKTEEKEDLRKAVANEKLHEKIFNIPERKEEWASRISISLLGTVQSEETKEKRKKSRRKAQEEGRLKGCKSHSMSDENKDKMTKARKISTIWRAVMSSEETSIKKRLSTGTKVTIDDILYDSIREAVKKTELNYNLILDIRDGKKTNDRVSFL